MRLPLRRELVLDPIPLFFAYFMPLHALILLHRRFSLNRKVLKQTLSTIDEYFQVPDYGETYPFSVRGQTIFLDNCSLAAALAELPEQSQEEIFLYYFQHLKQKEIGEQSGWTRSTIGRHIQLALKRLKEVMEVLSHE